MANRKAVETLGMPQGTASSRLRKMLLFRQLKKHNENVCVRCEKEIELVDELSVEHIRPWEGRLAALFWDLDNVGFSHMMCNQAGRVSRQKEIGERQRRVAPEGTAWCFRCEQFKQTILFDRDAGNWSGFNKECKKCKGERNALRVRRQVSRPGAPDGGAPLS